MEAHDVVSTVRFFCRFYPLEGTKVQEKIFMNSGLEGLTYLTLFYGLSNNQIWHVGPTNVLAQAAMHGPPTENVCFLTGFLVRNT